MTALPYSSAAVRPAAIRPAGEAERLLGHVLGVAGFLLLPAAVFAPLAATPLLGLAGLLVVATGRRRLEAAWRPLGPSVLVALLLLVLGAVSARWSVVPAASLRLAGQLALTAVASFLVIGGALVLNPPERRVVRGWLVAGVILGIALLAVEWRWQGPVLRFFTHRTVATLPSITRLDRGETVMAILVWPAAAALAMMLAGRGGGRAVFGWLLAAILVVAAFLLSTRLAGASGKAALGLGTLGFLLACLGPRTMARIAAVLAFVGVVAMPLAPPLVDAATAAYPGRVEFSTLQRVAIWYFTADRVAERPLTGWGLDASRAMPGGHDQALLATGSVLPAGSESLPLHPHNNALQWWLELGLGGAVLGGLMMAIAFWGAGGWAPRTGVAAGAAIALVMMVSYGAWQFWWLATIALASAMVVAVARRGFIPAPSERPTITTLTGQQRY